MKQHNQLWNPLAHVNFKREAVCESEEQERERVSVEPLWKDGLTFHHLGLIISAVFGALAVAISFFLIWRHVSHYLRPYEQKHIIRILLMIPIYAVVSFLSYLNYKHAIYFEVLRDCYEAFAIASFFTLMCHYIAPTLHEQKQYFRDIELKNWVWPLPWLQKCTGGENKGIFRKPQSGLTWFNIVWISVFQYCFIRPFFTIVAVTTQALGRYCQSSKDPRYAYIWVAGFEAVSVTIAMYCLVQFYIQLKQDLAPHRPFLKITCIKLVIFFCFWQSWVISLLTTKGGPLKPTAKIAGPDWRIGLPSMLVCVEMTIFATMHIFAFPWKPYDLKRVVLSDDTSKHYTYGPLYALISSFNPWDFVKAFARGLRWLFVGVRRRKEDPSYQRRNTSVGGYQQGPTFAGNGEPATEMMKQETEAGKNGSGESDTIGLLSNAQANPYAHQGSIEAQSYRSDFYDNPDRLPSAPTPGQEYGLVGGVPGRTANFETQDTSYHGASNTLNPPRYQEQDLGRPSTEWDMFAGANMPGTQRPGGAPPGMI